MPTHDVSTYFSSIVYICVFMCFMCRCICVCVCDAGGGKTTQVKILAGELEPTAGELVKSSKDLRVSFLRQEFVDELVMERSLKDELVSVFVDEAKILSELQACEVSSWPRILRNSIIVETDIDCSTTIHKDAVAHTPAHPLFDLCRQVYVCRARISLDV